MKPNRKLKKSDSSSKLVLENIIGLTTKNLNGLASNFCSRICVYVAGCVVVVYNVDLCAQSHLMVCNRMPKPLSCVALSCDARFVAAGESGNQPAVLVWDVATNAFISELKGHPYGVTCVAFSPDGKYLVSVGGYICLWDWQSGMLVTKLKAISSCSVISSVSFTSDAKFIVTAGKKHLKFWSLRSSPYTRLSNGTGSMTMHGKPVNLGIQKGSSFVSVTSPNCIDKRYVNSEQSGEGFAIYALTDAGVLCLIHSGLSVTNVVDLKVEKGYALSVSDNLIACACNNGIVQLFAIDTLKYVVTLQYSKAKNCNGESESGLHSKSIEKVDQLADTLPDAIACQFLTSEKLVVIYGDHSLYIWDVHDMNQAFRCLALVSHSACIWDIKNLFCENKHDPSTACAGRGCSGGVSFATCSSDGTIRLWDLALQCDSLDDSVYHHSQKIESMGTTKLVNAGIFVRDTVQPGVSTQGFRAMAASLDGKYLAAGDCEGNLHIYNLQTSDYTCFEDVHDTEILSLSFSLATKNDLTTDEDGSSNYFLASGARDRIIHLYDVKRDFHLIESIYDHSAAVTSVKLTCDGRKILSCSADRSLVFRDVAVTDGGCKISRRHQQMASQGTVYDMDVDQRMEEVVTVGQDKKINTYEVSSGKLIRSFKQDKIFGDPIKVTIDPSCSYLVCSYSDKSIRLYDFLTGEIVAQALGHGEVVTGAIFLPDCRHIISVGGDGCIFVWRVPAHLSSRMLQKMYENSGPLSPGSLAQPVAFMFSDKEGQQRGINPRDESFLETSNQLGKRVQATPVFRFSISRLPKWAQADVTCSDFISASPMFSSFKKAEPKNLSPLADDGREYTPVYLEVQTPVKHELQSSESDLDSLFRNSPDFSESNSSLTPQQFPSCCAKEKHWRTVYTVCLDFFNSPQIWDLKNTKMPVSYPNFFQDPVDMLSNVEPSLGHGGHIRNATQGASSEKYSNSNKHNLKGKNRDKLETHNARTFRDAVAGDVLERLHSDKTESKVQAVMDVTDYCMESEDSDLFKQHFCNLSTIQKMERRKSSVRRYSARYVVRQENLGGSKRLFDTPLKDSGGKTLCVEETSTHILPKDPAIKVLEERSSEQEPKTQLQSLLNQSGTLQRCELSKSCVSPDQKGCIPKGNEGQERIIACKEALLNLDAAAEHAMQLFLNFRTLISTEELSGEHGAQLYKDTSKLFPSISEKVNVMTNLMKHNNNDSEHCNANVSGYETMLGTFAENLSQRVVQILKNNLTG